jgi:hypothetical protein
MLTTELECRLICIRLSRSEAEVGIASLQIPISDSAGTDLNTFRYKKLIPENRSRSAPCMTALGHGNGRAQPNGNFPHDFETQVLPGSNEPGYTVERCCNLLNCRWELRKVK